METLGYLLHNFFDMIINYKEEIFIKDIFLLKISLLKKLYKHEKSLVFN